MIKFFGISILIVLLTACGSAQVESGKTALQSTAPAKNLQLYEGEARAPEEVARVITAQSAKDYLYFIGLDGQQIPNNSLIDGPREIAVLPGRHVLRLRFVSPGEIAIPLKPLPPVTLEAGKVYIVKASMTPGQGGYPQSIMTTSIEAWLQEVDSDAKLAAVTTNGTGR
ncbi:hypothetical protein [Microbulbifer sp.]|uniref:hypothetical protein n=1 Tax=Microbulbifer sp. TaxID=1908541 RepID=UPI003F30335B